MSNITVKSDGSGITVAAQGPQGPAGTGTDPTKLPLAGGTMSGDIDMDGNNILNSNLLDDATNVESLNTAETNTSKILAPDGLGGLEWIFNQTGQTFDTSETLPLAANPTANVFLYVGDSNATLTLESEEDVDAEYVITVENAATKTGRTLTLIPQGDDSIIGTTVLDVGDKILLERTGADEYTTTVVQTLLSEPAINQVSVAGGAVWNNETENWDESSEYASVPIWDYDLSIVMDDPGNGNMRFNNADLSLVTEIAIGDLTKQRASGSGILLDTETQTLMTIREHGEFANSASYIVTSTTDNTSWVSVAVTHVASTSFSGANADLGVTSLVAPIPQDTSDLENSSTVDGGAGTATDALNTLDSDKLQNGDNVSALVNDVPYLSSVTGGDHTTLANIGTNSHTQLDSHVADSTIHFTAASLNLGDKEDKANKSVANGYAALDGAGHVPASQLPSYVDDVLEFADLASFPVTGETGKIYVAIDTNLTYRWSGSVYVELTDTTAVWGNISGVLSNQTDLNSALNAKEDSFAKNTGFNLNLGSAASTVCEGDDSRLSDARVPLAHTQTASTITDFDVEVANNSAVTLNTAKNDYPPADASKLAGIEPLAEVNQTNSEIKTQYEANANTNAFTDSDATNLGNQSGANTGDQDLSGLALKSNVLELDNTTSFTPDADYEPATKKYVDDSVATSSFGELIRSTQGNQSLSTTKSKLLFNFAGGSSGMTVSDADDRITVLSDGNYRICLTGSAIIKKDNEYVLYIRINSASGTDSQISCFEDGEDNVCKPLIGSRILTLAENDYIEIWGTCKATKDFKMEVGTGFSIVEI